MRNRKGDISLSRIDYESKLPPNWGKRIYDSMLARDEAGRKILAPRPRVQAALEDVPTATGPVNCASILGKFSDEELCEFFSRLPDCQTLLLRGWQTLADQVIRCISITMGESITELDMSESKIQAVQIEILLVRFQKLKVIKLSGCPHLDGPCMSVLAENCGHTLSELYVDSCPLFKEVNITLCILTPRIMLT